MEGKASEFEARISQSSTREEALKNAISATESYMKAIQLASNERDREKLTTRCMKVLARAEEIKKKEVWPIVAAHEGSQGTAEADLRAPISDRIVFKFEDLILLESSRLHGLIFPPWTSDPPDSAFQEIENGKLYTDLSEMKLSKPQRMAFDGWKRPREVFRNGRIAGGLEKKALEPTMIPVRAIDLVQDVTADCSVVASLCAAIARPRNGCEKLLDSIFYPYNKSTRWPDMSQNGKYIFRLHFNGCFRKVIIDDRLPTSKTARTLHVIDRQNEGLLWPALLEKAYLKVRGGYDFPGSNSGTDLWVLTGWIPEQIFLQSDEIMPQELWRRIYKAFNFGDVVITLGTGKLSQREEEELGLAGEHDYAVLDMKEAGHQQLLLVKNPWSDGTVWKGTSPSPVYPPGGKLINSWAEELRDTVLEQSSTGLGTFWIAIEEVIRNFESLYLNWNPGLFRHRQDHHFTWKIPSLTSPACFVQNPQYSIRSTNGGTLWLLLSRHFSTEDHDIITLSECTNVGASSPLGFISLYVFDNGGKRIHLSDDAILRGPYVDSPQTLARIEMPPETCYTFVAAQQALPLPKYSFTLSAYSRQPVIIRQAESSYFHCRTLCGAWTSRTAGGNASASSYPTNPQFSILLQSPSDIALLLETSRPDLAVHINLVWAGGERVTAVTARDILGESGDYRRGCAFAKISNVAAGTYTVVCSTFEPAQNASFTLRVESMVPCEVRPVPSEEAGRLSVQLPVLHLGKGANRMLAPVILLRMTRLRVVARHCTGGVRSPLKLMLERGQGPHKSIIGISSGGNFSDAPAGIRISDVDVSPDVTARGGLWLVVERFGGDDAVDIVEVELLSDATVKVGTWGIGDG